MSVRPPNVYLYPLLPCARSSAHQTSIYSSRAPVCLPVHPPIIRLRALLARPSIRPSNNVHLPSRTLVRPLIRRSSLRFSRAPIRCPSAHPTSVCPLLPLANRPPASCVLAGLSIRVPAHPSIIRHALCHIGVANDALFSIWPVPVVCL